MVDTELADRFRERLLLFASRRLGDAAAAEDVAQETLRRVLVALREGRIENLAALPGFVFETARHICLHHYRSAGRESRALQRLHDGAVPGPAAPDALAALVTEETRARVRQALDALSAEDSELLRMLFHDDAGTAGAADRLAITPAAVRVRKHRALRRLRRLLGEDEA